MTAQPGPSFKSGPYTYLDPEPQTPWKNDTGFWCVAVGCDTTGAASIGVIRPSDSAVVDKQVSVLTVSTQSFTLTVTAGGASSTWFTGDTLSSANFPVGGASWNQLRKTLIPPGYTLIRTGSGGGPHPQIIKCDSLEAALALL